MDHNQTLPSPFVKASLYDTSVTSSSADFDGDASLLGDQLPPSLNTDDSFQDLTARLPPPPRLQDLRPKSTTSLSREERVYEYHGSMRALVESTQQASPPPLPLPTEKQKERSGKPIDRQHGLEGEEDVEDEEDFDPAELEGDGPEAVRLRKLKAERDALRKLNGVVAGLVKGFRSLKDNLDNFPAAIQRSHDLLDMYTEHLRQTHLTHELLSNGWEGTEADRETVRQLEEEARTREEERETQAREALEMAERERLKRERDREAAIASASHISSSSTRGRGRGKRGSLSSSSSSIARGSTRSVSGASAVGSKIGMGASASGRIGLGSVQSGGGRGRGSASVTGVRPQRGLTSRVVTKPRGRP